MGLLEATTRRLESYEARKRATRAREVAHGTTGDWSQRKGEKGTDFLPHSSHEDKNPKKKVRPPAPRRHLKPRHHRTGSKQCRQAILKSNALVNMSENRCQKLFKPLKNRSPAFWERLLGFSCEIILAALQAI